MLSSTNRIPSLALLFCTFNLPDNKTRLKQQQSQTMRNEFASLLFVSNDIVGVAPVVHWISFRLASLKIFIFQLKTNLLLAVGELHFRKFPHTQKQNEVKNFSVEFRSRRNTLFDYSHYDNLTRCRRCRSKLQIKFIIIIFRLGWTQSYFFIPVILVILTTFDFAK